MCLCNSYVCLSGRGLVCVALLLYTRTGISHGPKGDKADMVLIFTANLTDFHHFGMTCSFLPDFRHCVSWHAWLSEVLSLTPQKCEGPSHEKNSALQTLDNKGSVGPFRALLVPGPSRRFALEHMRHRHVFHFLLISAISQPTGHSHVFFGSKRFGATFVFRSRCAAVAVLAPERKATREKFLIMSQELANVSWERAAGGTRFQ